MMPSARDQLVAAVAAAATTARQQPSDYDAVLERTRSGNIVLIGDASHGTHEFYDERAAITKRLIDEQAFDAVAIEGDWPDAARVNAFVLGRSDDAGPAEALEGFRRFPAWMWRNVDVVSFLAWLRRRNDRRPAAERAGFVGLDLYSLFTSIDAVIAYLKRVDPDAAGRAKQRYACFDHFAEDTQAYGYAATAGITESCEAGVVAQLVDLRRRALEYASHDGGVAENEFFDAEQNARLTLNAERYYRAMFRGRNASWNLRDTHMADALDALVAHLRSRGRPGKIVVWAHNSHLGDARATEMGVRGEINLGQLVRERHPGESVSIGFTTNDGTVTAASEWDAPAERKDVRPALRGSVEEVMHRTGFEHFLLRLDDARLSALRGPLLERAIGVIYLPQAERQSHYVHARAASQFDFLIHLDRTTALEPLEPSAPWVARSEPPETYPFAL
jgi:erythromycin esterase-like protein